MRWFSPFTRLRVIALAVCVVSGTVVPASAAGMTGTVTSNDGTPIAGARVVLTGKGPEHRAVTDKQGKFRLADLPAGTYDVSATAAGFSPIGGRTIQVLDGGNDVVLALSRAQASSLTVIGTVNANGRRALSTAPGQSSDIATAPYAAQGVTRTSDILQQELSTTVQPVIGGGLNAPAVVSLRGPDPSETLVAVDGHQVNNGATGDFDLSLLDPADLQSVQVVYGIAPSSLFGPNTLGGALNVRTLEPTAQSHVLERFTAGTFDTNGETIQATGTQDRLGYAFSFHRLTSGGELSDYALPALSGNGSSTVSNALDASSTIAKLRYSLFNGGGFVGVSLRDQAVQRDISATTSSYDVSTNTYASNAGSSIASSNAAYALDAQAPLGRKNADGIVGTTAIFRYQTSFVRQLVNGPAAGSSPYLFDDRDLIGDTTLEIDHALPHGTLSLKAALTSENLDTGIVTGTSFADTDAVSRRPEASLRANDDDGGGGGAVGLGGLALVTRESLAQTQRSLGFRYTLDPTPKLHYSIASYYSDYSTFGHSLDPRAGFVWTPSGDTVVRISAGTSFESPQLLSLVVPPATTLYTPTNGYVTVGNPNLTAERATEYDAGYEHLFRIPDHALHLGIDLYRTNLRNGVATYVPSTPCAPNAPPTYLIYFKNTCLSYPVNVARGVYEGIELHGDVQVARFTSLHASYGINSVFTESAPAADNIVPGQQNLGVPLHKATLTLSRDPRGQGIATYAGILYEGYYNELNLPPYATVRAGITWHLHDFDLGLNGTNLTNAYDFKLTRVNGGVTYGGLSPTATGGGSLSTDAFPLAGRQFVLSLTHHV